MPSNAFGQPIGEAVPGWSQRPAPPRTPAEGRLCRLEPLDAERHSGSLFEAFAAAPDARDWTYMSHERPNHIESYRTFVAAQARSDDPLHHAIVVRDEEVALGLAAFLRVDRDNGVIEIGSIIFAPRLQRTAAATEAIFLLMCRAFDELRYRRLEWKCDRFNARSCRSAERLGFTFEGIFRQAVVTKGRNRDTAWYAMTDREWPRVRAALERWLDPDNFDVAGQQRSRLDTARG